MSEDFLRGQVNMAAESISYTGPDGRPLTAEKFTVFQSDLFLKKFKDINAFNQAWRDIKLRRHFLETEAADLGLHIHALESIFASKYQMREVDLYDVLSNMVYGSRYLTKFDRVEKAKSVNPAAFSGKDAKQAALIQSMVRVYQDSQFDSFSVSKEFWQTSTLRQHGSFSDIQNIAGGPDGLQNIVSGIQSALYDVRVVA